MRKLIMLLLACGCINAMASQVRMTPFLTTQSLKENLNSKDTAKYISAMSYIGGVADLLIKHGKICPPEGATVAKAVFIVKEDLNIDSHQYRYLPAVTPIEYALTIKWSCN